MRLGLGIGFGNALGRLIPFVPALPDPIPVITGTPQLESALMLDYGTSSTVTAARLMKRARGSTGNGTNSGKTIEAGTYTLQHGRDSDLLNQELALEVDVGGTTYRSAWTTPVGYYQSFTAPDNTKAYASPIFLPITADSPDREFIVVQNNRLKNTQYSNDNKVLFQLGTTTQQVESYQPAANNGRNAWHVVRSDAGFTSAWLVEYFDNLLRISSFSPYSTVKTFTYGSGISYSEGLFATIIDDNGLISCYRNSVLLTTYATNNTKAGGYAGFFITDFMTQDDVRVIGGAGAGNPGIPTGASAMTAETVAFDSGNLSTQSTNLLVDGFGDGTSQPHEFRVSESEAPYTVMKDWSGSYTSFPAVVTNVPITSAKSVVVNGRPVGSTANTSLTLPRKLVPFKRTTLGSAPQGQDYYFVEHPFANLARVNPWRPWNNLDISYSPSTPGNVIDATTGHPNSIPADSGGQALHLARCLTPGANCILAWDGDPNAVFQIQLRGTNNSLITPAAVSTGRRRFAYTHSWLDKDSFATLRLVSMDTGNPVRNLRVFQESMGDVLFQPQAITRYSAFSTGSYMRIMDLAVVNNPEVGQLGVIDVGNLTTPAYLQVNSPYGISDRDFIKFCFLAGKNAWINLKFGETEAATRARLALYRDGFTENGTLYKIDKIIIEAPGNEPWNETFGKLKRRCASYHLNADAATVGFDQPDVYKGMAKRAIEMFTIVEDVFSGQMNRIDRTMSLQLDAGEDMVTQLNQYIHPNGQKMLDHVDSYSPAIYIADNMQGTRNSYNGNSADWSDWSDDFTTLFGRITTTSVSDGPRWRSWPYILRRLRAIKQVAADLGKQINTYEGQTVHFSMRALIALETPEATIQANLATKPFPGGQYATYLDWFKAFNADPRWRALQEAFLRELLKLGGNHVNFVTMATPDDYGHFGLIFSEGQPEAEQYKFLGLKDAVAYANAA